MLLIRLATGTHLEDLRLIDHQLAILADGDLKSIERPGRRPLEVQAGFEKAAAVARTFKLVLGGKPARRAAKMSALGENSVDPDFFADDPDALILLVFFAHFTDGVVGNITGFKSCRRLEKHPWKRRAEKPKETQPAEDSETTPAQARKEVSTRPDTSFFLFCHARLSLDPANQRTPDNKDHAAQH